MNTTVPEGLELAATLRDRLADLTAAEVVLLPPFTHLWPLREVLEGGPLLLGAQDVHWKEQGAWTGEISPLMLEGWCDVVLVGHSERRHLMGETDEMVGWKARAAVEHGLRVMVAVGETEQQRDAGATLSVVEAQLAAIANGPTPVGGWVIAYEPVWAIGTGRTATPEQAQEVCAHVRTHLTTLMQAGSQAAASLTAGASRDVRVLYGGSVTAATAAALFACPDIDGALVGGASLKPDDFVAIVDAAVATCATAAEPSST